MLVLPRHHDVHLSDAEPQDVSAIGRAIRTCLAKMRGTLGDVSYNVVFHTAPHRHAGPYHWHVHLVPRLTSIPGFEQGTGVAINIIPPELAARRLVDTPVSRSLSAAVRASSSGGGSSGAPATTRTISPGGSRSAAHAAAWASDPRQTSSWSLVNSRATATRRPPPQAAARSARVRT